MTSSPPILSDRNPKPVAPDPTCILRGHTYPISALTFLSYPHKPDSSSSVGITNISHVRGCLYTSNTQLLCSGDVYGNVKVWNVDIKECIKECDLSGGTGMAQKTKKNDMEDLNGVVSLLDLGDGYVLIHGKSGWLRIWDSMCGCRGNDKSMAADTCSALGKQLRITTALGFCRVIPIHLPCPNPDTTSHITPIACAYGPLTNQIAIMDLKQDAIIKILASPPLASQNPSNDASGELGMITCLIHIPSIDLGLILDQHKPGTSPSPSSSISDSHSDLNPYPEGLIISGHDGGLMVLWDLASGSIIHRIRASMEPILQLARFGLDVVSTGASSKVSLWSIEFDHSNSNSNSQNQDPTTTSFSQRKLNLVEKCHVMLRRQGVGSLNWRQDGKIVVIGCWDGNIRVLKGKTESKSFLKPLAVLKHHTGSYVGIFSLSLDAVS